MKEFPYSHGDVFFINGVSMVVEDAKKVNDNWTTVWAYPTFGEGDIERYHHLAMERGQGILHTTTPDGQELSGAVNWSSHPPTPGVISSVLDADDYPRFELQLKSGLKIVITENDEGYVKDVYVGDTCIDTYANWNTDYENLGS